MGARTPSVNPTATLGTAPLSHPLIDEVTGKVTMPWAAWLNLLYARVGQGANNNIQNAQSAAELAAIGADQSGDISAAADELRDEIACVVDTSEGRLAALRDELRAEIASQIDGVSNQAFRDFVSSQFEYENGWNQQINDALTSIIINLATQVTGTLAIANGGTGQVTASAAFTALAPSQTGNAGRSLRTDGTSASWAFPAAPTTVAGSTYTVSAADASLIFSNSSCTVTLPAPAANTGRVIYMKCVVMSSVSSASSNVVPLASTTAGSTIFTGMAGRLAMLQSDGTNWVTMLAN